VVVFTARNASPTEGDDQPFRCGAEALALLDLLDLLDLLNSLTVECADDAAVAS